MIDLLLILAQLAAVAGIAAALVLPRARGPVAGLLAALGLLAVVAAPFGGDDGSRSLGIVHYFAAYEGNEIAVHPFPVEIVEAPAWRWGVFAAAFCLSWAMALMLLRPRAADALAQRRLGEGVAPFLVPLLLAWSGIAAQLLLEKSAAPRALVAPVGWERVLVPPCLAAAVLIANRCRRLLPSIAWLALFTTVARLPLAVFGTFATLHHWGTSLDVHDTEVFANPFAQVATEVEPGSAEQLAWLLWGPHLLVFPGLYMLSLVGVAFAVVMIVTHPPEPEQ